VPCTDSIKDHAMRHRWPLLLALATTLVAAPATAAAQSPLDLGAGENASVVVDAAGTAHIVFNATAGGEGYCRLPRKATACDVRTALPLDERLGRPAILQRADGVLLIVATTNESIDGTDLTGRTYVWTSGDRGATWSEPVPSAAGSDDLSRALLAPDGQAVLTLADSAGFAGFQRAPLSGSETRTLDLSISEDSPAYVDLATVSGGRMLAIIGSGKAVSWRFFGGGDPYDLRGWPTRGTLRNVAEAEVLSGPRGTFLFEHRSLAAQRTGSFAPPFAFRAFDAAKARFGAARTAAADRSIFGSSTAVQDASGRLHVIADTSGAGRTTCVLYARTGRRSSQWFGRTTVLFKTTLDARKPTRVGVGAAPDGQGVAVWQDSRHVWVTALHQDKGAYRAKARQHDRPACTGTRYSAKLK
jgi:hypothetical protein